MPEEDSRRAQDVCGRHFLSEVLSVSIRVRCYSDSRAEHTLFLLPLLLSVQVIMAQSDSDLSSLSIFPATADQVIESRKRTYAQWNAGRTVDEYLRRDSILDEFDNSANHKLTTW